MTISKSDPAESIFESQMMSFATRAIHAGCEPDLETGAVAAPIYMTSTYAQPYPGKDKGYDYTRAGNPGFTRLEQQLGSLECAKFCTVVSSGLAAITAVLNSVLPGQGIVFLNSMYGGTFRLLKENYEPRGVRLVSILYKDHKDMDTILANQENIKFLILESPTNPLMEIVDIALMCGIAKKHGVKVVVDNTFATPYLQQPLLLGADVVVHSSTKYLGGHSDVLGGAVVTNDAVIDSAAKFQRKCVGFNPSPFDAWLVSRSIKTLHVRMDRHCQNALKVAKFLESNKTVHKVYYPGLESDQNHVLAKQQMSKGFGGMLSVEFKLTLNQMKSVISAFKVFTLAESLGGVESLVCHPATMTHASLPVEERNKIGLGDSLVRLSIGLEDSDDLICDITQALNSISIN